MMRDANVCIAKRHVCAVTGVLYLTRFAFSDPGNPKASVMVECRGVVCLLGGKMRLKSR